MHLNISLCISISVLQDKNGQKGCISQHHKPRTKNRGLVDSSENPPGLLKAGYGQLSLARKGHSVVNALSFLKDGFWVGFSWTFGFWLLLMFSA
jgi:hypothetical protein